ncbi:effector-associated constant component EACC1 [Catellatospora sichuanensis]|uniref:effector-associated constant component EACC1 n=1 Tax=Catellatospora sichuanensis TaxID=1969805 RepID=UPI001184238C|nr:hypothetical protein [Catellatospora sichuanensis]
MEIRLAVDGRDGDLQSLWEWLRSEHQLRGKVREERIPASAGTMGSTAELIVLLASTNAATALAQSVAVWLIQRRSHVTVTVKLPDGRSVAVKASRAADAEKLVRTVLESAVVQPVLPGQALSVDEG